MKTKKVRGSALISALFIMTLVVIAATAISTRLQFDIYRTHLMLASDQLLLASQAVNFWATETLKESNEHEFPLAFPKRLQLIYPNVRIKGELHDLQARFNINNLRDPKFHPLFLAWLGKSIKESVSNNTEHLLAITYWIAPFQSGRGQDQYLNYYLKRPTPYLPSYQAMQSPSELRLIQGITKRTYQRILASLIALPETTPINITTVPKEFISTLGLGLKDSEVDALLQAREVKDGSRVEKIYQLLHEFNIPMFEVTTKSTYFLSVATVVSDSLNLTVYTVIKRIKDRNNQIAVSIIRQSFNTL